MKAFIYGNHTYGDKIIISYLQNAIDNCEYLGAKVDLSRIIPVEENLIIISNSSLFHIDQDKILGYIKKDLSKPLMIVRKLKTFGTVLFKPNFEVDRITTNKSYNFAGMLYLPKKYFDMLDKKTRTIAEIFRTVDYADWRFYIVDGRKK